MTDKQIDEIVAHRFLMEALFGLLDLKLERNGQIYDIRGPVTLNKLILGLRFIKQ